MRKFITLCLMLLPVVGWAQTKVEIDTETVGVTLMYQYDLDGEAADDDQIVASADLADSTTYTIAAQPDTCRLVDATVTDANSSITSGTLTITGVDCLGYVRVGVLDFSVVANRGTGIKTFTVTTGPVGSSLYLSSVTSVITSVLATEAAGVDVVKVGYTTNSANGWAISGVAKPVGALGEHGVDPFKSTLVSLPITTSGTASTTVTSVGDAGSFTSVSVGDEILVTLDGALYSRIVTAKASVNSITINKALLIPARGAAFQFKKFYFTTDPLDDVWFPVKGWRYVMPTFDVAANANTGGVVTLFECTPMVGPNYPNVVWHTIDTQTVATGQTLGASAVTLDRLALPMQACRFGVKFGTGDDADGANENISAYMMLVK